MRKIKILAVIAAMMLPLCAMAQNDGENEERIIDSIYVYNSWEGIFNATPDTLVTSLYPAPASQYDISFREAEKAGKQALRYIRGKSAAVALGDTTWLISSNYLKRNFKSDDLDFHSNYFMPLFFTGKIAFIQHLPMHGGGGFGAMLLEALVDGLVGDVYVDDEYSDEPAKLYLIDFENKTVRLVDHNLLSSLLERYTDLQRRYESMRDYKKTYIINDYFLQYVDRIGYDDDVPYLF